MAPRCIALVAFQVIVATAIAQGVKPNSAKWLCNDQGQHIGSTLWFGGEGRVYDLNGQAKFTLTPSTTYSQSVGKYGGRPVAFGSCGAGFEMKDAGGTLFGCATEQLGRWEIHISSTRETWNTCE